MSCGLRAGGVTGRLGGGVALRIRLVAGNRRRWYGLLHTSNRKMVGTMTTITIPSTRSQRRRDIHSGGAPLSTAVTASPLVAPVSPHQCGGTVAFEIRFESPMTGADLELLRRQLALTTHVEHKLPVDPSSPAVARLDHYSGLFLEHDRVKDRWVLQARTWCAPSAPTVHGWRVRVAQVVRQLDPTAELPERIPVVESRASARPVDRAANGQLAAVRRRLVGIA